MPLLLAIPLAVIIALAVFVVVFPLSLLQRFRMVLHVVRHVDGCC